MSSNPQSALRAFVASYLDLLTLPRAFWYIILAFVLESAAYFGVLTLMTSYLNRDLAWSEAHATIAVSIFTMLVTLCMLGIGSWAERFGLRHAIAVALLISTGGRILYCLAANYSARPALATAVVLISLLLVACGSGILQPLCYSGVKQYTNEKTSSMGYAFIYAIMNLSIVGIGALSAWVRPGVEKLLSVPSGSRSGPLAFLASFSSSGFNAVNWLCVAITALTLVLFLTLMTKRAEAEKLRPDIADPATAHALLSIRFRRYFTEGPFSNARFIFFIFMLLPVRTLFAHQWLTMPEYILRAYPGGVADRMEWLVNWINPLIIFFGVPIITALTRGANVYRLMVLGSLVSAAPTFLLCFGANLSTLLIYFVLFSIGEAIWSARFLEFASELAPPGRVSQYMGLANIPWLLAKGTTGFYAGYLLAHYVPKDLPPVQQTHTGTLWFIYGCIAMLSPIGLWLAHGWVMSGWHLMSAKPQPAEA